MKKLLKYIGKVVHMRVEKTLIVQVKIVDVRKVYNREDALIIPVNGSGKMWVSFDRLSTPA